MDVKIWSTPLLRGPLYDCFTSASANNMQIAENFFESGTIVPSTRFLELGKFSHLKTAY